VDLVKAGFDPKTIQDPLFYFNVASKTYETLGPSEFQNIVAGKARL
jgi:hypothetical protein